MRHLKLVSDPSTLNAALEVWYIQNRMMDGLPFTLTQDTGGLRDCVIVYLELGGADINYIHSLKSRGNKVVLFQMGDEYARKTREAYPHCDGVIRNYYFREVFDDPAHTGRVFWSPNGFKGGVGPRDPARLKRPTSAATSRRSWVGCRMPNLSATNASCSRA